VNRRTGFWISLALCTCVVTASLFSESFIAAHADHDCRGEGCPVCLQIQGAQIFSRQCKYAVTRPGLSPGAAPVTALVLRFAVFHLVPINSVRLKVKMNE
jgi:hypothetical protein